MSDDPISLRDGMTLEEADGYRRQPTEREREVFDLYQTVGTQAEVARRLGITQGAVSSMLQRYRSKMGGKS